MGRRKSKKAKNRRLRKPEEPTATHSNKNHSGKKMLAVILSSVIGATVSDLIFEEVVEIHSWLSFLALVAAMFGVISLFIHPLQTLMNRMAGVQAGEHDPSEKVRLQSIVIVLLITFIGLLGEMLVEHKLTEENPIGMVGLFGEVLITIGSVTYFWMKGMRLQPPRPSLLGAIGGGLTGALTSFFYIDMVLHTRLDEALGRALGKAITWGIFGLFGGMAAQWGRGKHWRRPGLGVAATIVTLDVIWQILAYLVFGAKPSSAISNVVITTGWGAGLILNPYSSQMLQMPFQRDQSASS